MTPLGLRQYRHLPLGLVDSGAVMQHALQQTLEGLDGVVVYIDNILIFAETKEAHDAILRQVLHHLHANDFRLQLCKCLFHMHTVPFLGRILSKEGISLNPKNVKAIKDAPTPTTLKQLHSFLNAISYYSIFLPHLTDVAEPLRAMLRGQIPHFDWTTDCQTAFVALKDAISEHLQLGIFDPCCSTSVNVDASDVGLGATRTQEQLGQEVTIMCISHTLTDTERR